MYTAIGHVRSRAMRVLWMLEELEVNYEYLPYRPRTPEMLAANPHGKSPALKVDGTVLTDSAAIMSFLADRHGKFTYPCGTIERGLQDGLIHQINDEMDALLWAAARHTFVLPEEHRRPEVKDSLRWEFTRNCDRIATRLQGPYLMGDEMTVPDMLLTHCLNWAHNAKFTCENKDLLEFAKQMRDRPAFKRAFALGD